MRSLQTLHGQGIYHRDISPDNMMFSGEGELKLIDFGGAKQMTTITGSSYFVTAKEGYTPPEQYLNLGTYRRKDTQGPWLDIYAMAATFLYCLLWEKPVSAAAQDAQMDAKLKQELTSHLHLAKPQVQTKRRLDR